MPFLSNQIKTEPRLGTLKGTSQFKLVSSMIEEERDILKEIRSYYKTNRDLPTTDINFLKGILLRRTTASNQSVNGLSPRQLLNEVGKLSMRRGVKDIA